METKPNCELQIIFLVGATCIYIYYEREYLQMHSRIIITPLRNIFIRRNLNKVWLKSNKMRLKFAQVSVAGPPPRQMAVGCPLSWVLSSSSRCTVWCQCATTFSPTEVIFSFWQNNYLCSERTSSLAGPPRALHSHCGGRILKKGGKKGRLFLADGMKSMGYGKVAANRGTIVKRWQGE